MLRITPSTNELFLEESLPSKKREQRKEKDLNSSKCQGIFKTQCSILKKTQTYRVTVNLDCEVSKGPEPAAFLTLLQVAWSTQGLTGSLILQSGSVMVTFVFGGSGSVI